MLLIILILFSSFAMAEGYPETIANDTRLVRTSDSPAWLAAVGRQITNLGNKKFRGCSLSIIADQIGKDGIVVAGAGHCITQWHQGSGKYEIGEHSVTFVSNSGERIVRRIKKILASEMNPGDYFIGILDKAIPYTDIRPLLNAPYDYTDMLQFPFRTEAYMAGYSADKDLGQKGNALTYDNCARLNGGASGMKKAYCHSYKGASGGPVVITLDFSKVGNKWNPYVNDKDEWEGIEDDLFEWFQEDIPAIKKTEYAFFVGTIVGGRPGDDNSRTLFTETTHYSKTLTKILSKY